MYLFNFQFISNDKQFFPFSQAKDHFLQPLKDQTAKEGKDKKVDFEAKFTKPNAKPKWFCRKNVCIIWTNFIRNDISID